MENIACQIRQIYIFEENHNKESEIKYICDFVQIMSNIQNEKDIPDEYKKFYDEYKNKVK